jgi:hypothetical protein
MERRVQHDAVAEFGEHGQVTAAQPRRGGALRVEAIAMKVDPEVLVARSAVGKMAKLIEEADVRLRRVARRIPKQTHACAVCTQRHVQSVPAKGHPNGALESAVRTSVQSSGRLRVRIQCRSRAVVAGGTGQHERTAASAPWREMFDRELRRCQGLAMKRL